MSGSWIPDREREHPDQPRQHLGPPFEETPEDDLGVRQGAEPVAATLELRPQRAKVVDLAIEDESETGRRVDHGLTAARDVDHAQAAEAETDGAVEVEAVFVGAAMAERVAHPDDEPRVGPPDAVAMEDADDAAHQPVSVDATEAVEARRAGSPDAGETPDAGNGPGSGAGATAANGSPTPVVPASGAR